jgi:hypothetical protein
MVEPVNQSGRIALWKSGRRGKQNSPDNDRGCSMTECRDRYCFGLVAADGFEELCLVFEVALVPDLLGPVIGPIVALLIGPIVALVVGPIVALVIGPIVALVVGPIVAPVVGPMVAPVIGPMVFCGCAALAGPAVPGTDVAGPPPAAPGCWAMT